MVYSALASFIISTAITLLGMYLVNDQHEYHGSQRYSENQRMVYINILTTVFVINAIIHAVWIFFVW